MIIEEADFQLLKNYMYNNYGINLANKQALVEGRLSSLLEKRGFKGFKEYVATVIKDFSGQEAITLVTKLTTNYTYFMREAQHYDYLQTVALPYWKNNIRDYDLRTWSAGCSSGEEAYTAAMAINRFFGLEKERWNTQILATDISANVLEAAKSGTYAADKLKTLPEAWQHKYLKAADNDCYQVIPELRQEVKFDYFNLMEPSYAKKFIRPFHVIFCRNVMIYFDKETREAVVNKFYDALAPGGYFFIGTSETLNNLNTKFTYIKPAIYRKEAPR